MLLIYLVEALKAFLCLVLRLWGLPDVSFMHILQVVEQRLPDWYLLQLDRRALQELPLNRTKDHQQTRTTGPRGERCWTRAPAMRVLGWTSLLRCLQRWTPALCQPLTSCLSKPVSGTVMSESQKPFPRPDLRSAGLHRPTPGGPRAPRTALSP